MAVELATDVVPEPVAVWLVALLLPQPWRTVAKQAGAMKAPPRARIAASKARRGMAERINFVRAYVAVSWVYMPAA